MKTKITITALFLISLLFIACEESVTESVLGTNSVTLSGDISKTFAASALAAMTQQDTLSIFTVILFPEGTSPENENVLTLMKNSTTLPSVGKYDIDLLQGTSDQFGGIYLDNDSTIYIVNTGEVEITESNVSKIKGTFDLKGYYLGFPVDSTRVLNVKGEFSTIPINLD